jgi:DNA-binding response OmpR family regulator
MPSELILVIEDEPNIREIVTLYLQRGGYQVHAVDDGRQAQQWLAKQLPDLIIMDLMLPEIDGYELTAQIRTRSDVPIIMLTSRREEVDRIAGLEMGADDYVVKPFSPQELVSRVRAVLRRTRPMGDDAVEPIMGKFRFHRSRHGDRPYPQVAREDRSGCIQSYPHRYSLGRGVSFRSMKRMMMDIGYWENNV